MASEKEVVHDAPSSFKAAPESLTVAQLNQNNRKYWEQEGGQTFDNHTYRENQGRGTKGQ